MREENEARGFLKGEDEFVPIEDEPIEDEDLDPVELESTHAINIDRFVPADSIGWMWFDRPPCLAHADAVGAEALR